MGRAAYFVLLFSFLFSQTNDQPEGRIRADAHFSAGMLNQGAQGEKPSCFPDFPCRRYAVILQDKDRFFRGRIALDFRLQAIPFRVLHGIGGTFRNGGGQYRSGSFLRRRNSFDGDGDADGLRGCEGFRQGIPPCRIVLLIFLQEHGIGVFQRLKQ